MHLADWPAQSARRYSALPIVMLLAERLASTVAPASAPQVLGGMGTQRSSHTSTKSAKPSTFTRFEYEIVPERHDLPEEVDVATHRQTAWRELAALVKLAVVGQIGLGRDPEEAPSVNHDSGVEELPLEAEWSTDDDRGGQAAAPLDEARERLLDAVEQGVLMKQVVIAVGRDAELGKDRQDGAVLGCVAGE